MFFSIILPVRNGGEYLKLCVQSILSQTRNNFNLIILDNCSTDGSLEYIGALNDSRIVLHPAGKPLTIEENWGRILSVDKNEFITLIGHDDILFTDYLEEMESLINKYPDAGLYQTHFNYINYRGQVIRKCKQMAETEDGPQFLKTYLQNKIDIMGTGFMMRSADFNKLGGMPLYPNLLFADFELWLNLADISFKATSRKECFSFRLHSSATSTSSDLKFQNAFEQFVFFLVSLKKRKPQFKDVIQNYSNDFLLFYCKGLSHRLLRTPIKKREGLSIKLFLKKCSGYADLLGTNKVFQPILVPAIFIASALDKTGIGRFLFLTFKKMYKKPILK